MSIGWHTCAGSRRLKRTTGSSATGLPYQRALQLYRAGALRVDELKRERPSATIRELRLEAALQLAELVQRQEKK